MAKAALSDDAFLAGAMPPRKDRLGWLLGLPRLTVEDEVLGRLFLEEEVVVRLAAGMEEAEEVAVPARLGGGAPRRALIAIVHWQAACP